MSLVLNYTLKEFELSGLHVWKIEYKIFLMIFWAKWSSYPFCPIHHALKIETNLFILKIGKKHGRT